MKKLILIVFGLFITTQSFAYDGISESIQTGRKTVTTAGTREQLTSTSTACTRVIITAETDNTGVIVVGGGSVVASLSTRQGTPLAAGNSVTIPISNLDKIWIDTTIDTDGVLYTWFD